MIIIAIYKRDQDVSDDDKDLFYTNTNNPEDSKPQKDESQKSKTKPYVWIQPPKSTKLKLND